MACFQINRTCFDIDGDSNLNQNDVFWLCFGEPYVQWRTRAAANNVAKSQGWASSMEAVPEPEYPIRKA